MSREKFSDLVSQDAQTLRQEAVSCRKALLRFRMKGKDESVKPHIVRQVRRQIARIKTAQNVQALKRTKGE